MCVLHPVVHDNNRDALAGHVVLPHPRDVYVHAFIVDVVLVEKERVRSSRGSREDAEPQLELTCLKTK